MLKIGDGDKEKEIDSVKYIIQELINFGANRSTILIAFGGGSVGDIVGFVSSIYMRGIQYINIPTINKAVVWKS